ncbi:MAG: UDP-N-acetylmuramate--L-alanine ligase [Alicyclobacillus sp.]|nr:UDP-N-acetylmuramate--L-alanine ligase [Alicyclobacillus sp.]
MKYHLIGIKGSGMSALAQLLSDWGETVQGSDVEKRFFTQEKLEQRGIPIYSFGQGPLEGIDICVSSTAFLTHPEADNARELGAHVCFYQEALGKLIDPYDSIAVSGSHGKTTTTTLIAHVLRKLQPINMVIGDGTGEGHRDAKWFVLEACEYRRHFLAYQPSYAVITNIDFDHPDYFVDINDVFDAFQQFAAQTTRCVVVNGDDVQSRRIRAKKLRTFGFSASNDVFATNIQSLGLDGSGFTVVMDGVPSDGWLVPMHGQHNILNALACVAVLTEAGVPIEVIRDGLRDVVGAKRRFTETRIRDLILVDDYAHHPSEVRATIQAARDKYPHRRLVSVFQPHTYSRIGAFGEQFAEELRASDEVYICKVFGSQRERDGAYSENHLLERIEGAKLLEDIQLEALADAHDSVILFMGAGDIEQYEQRLIEILEHR